MINDDKGKFRKGKQVSYGRDDAITLGDLTGDGRIDLFAIGENAYRIWRGQGDGRFTPDSRTNYGI
jgi:hypothetical protein